MTSVVKKFEPPALILVRLAKILIEPVRSAEIITSP